MANFQTHLGVGTAVVGLAALAAHGEGLSDFPRTQWLFFVGVAASLLPDIDADDSHPVRGFFALLGVAAGFFLATALWDRLRFIELALLWVGVWLFVAFPLRLAFSRLTVHRGIFHSLLMAGAVALAVVNVAAHGLALEPTPSWLFGAFALLGYLTHLTLDEIASIDLTGNRVKRSFGTALKPLSTRSWGASLLVFGLALGLFYSAPAAPDVFAGVRLAALDVTTWPLKVEDLSKLLAKLPWPLD